jgi:hypothetical protein
MQMAPSGSGGAEHDAWSVRGKSCLELGCGTGLTGLTAIALQCEQCTFTGTKYSLYSGLYRVDTLGR